MRAPEPTRLRAREIVSAGKGHDRAGEVMDTAKQSFDAIHPKPSKDAFDTDGWNAAKYRAAIFAAFVAAADSVAAGPDA